MKHHECIKEKHKLYIIHMNIYFEVKNKMRLIILALKIYTLLIAKRY